MRVVGEGVEFRFTIASKGGGQTEILFTLGKGDLPGLLKELAAAKPEFVAVFAESTHIAVLKALEAGSLDGTSA
ncbi:MAG TPA: hypothetical protein VHT73_12175 [Thermodesulfobacteriota bacterium]|nr:hypothetical protein [Thermodesulfobacteriota bacterium]